MKKRNIDMIKGFAMVLSAGLILGCVTGVVWMGGEAVQAGRGTDVVSQEEPGPGGAAEAADDSEVAAGQEISVSGAAVESQTAPEGLTNEKTKEKIERNEDGRLEFSVAGNEEALAGLPKEVLAQIEGINAGVAVYGAKKGGIPDLLEKDKYMFEPDINSIYQFTKDKIEKKAYVLYMLL